LIGISPTGPVIFASDLYPGNISDKELGLLGRCMHAVMIDYGFEDTVYTILRGISPHF